MISYSEARAILLNAGRSHRLGHEVVSLSCCSGRICAKKLEAPLAVQPFDNSAMDGFAVRRQDLANAAAGSPVKLRQAGMVAAGDRVPDSPVSPGTCIQIMTGAPVPPGADAVIPVELSVRQGDGISFSAQPEQNANIRFAGEDFKKGDLLLAPGRRIAASHILPLATLGIGEITVVKQPVAAFLATGRELVDDLSTPLGSGQIYNSNRPYALAMLEEMGVKCIHAETIADEPEAFARVLDKLIAGNPDLIVSSGAVSAGEFDFVRAGLENAGAEIFFHKVKIKPGKPNLLARLPNGTLYFGLPGNPVATAAGLRFFVEPVLRTMAGMGEETPFHAKLMTPFPKKRGLHLFLKARTEGWDDGIVTVDILDGQASFMISPFLAMNCWASIPEDNEDLRAGEIVDLYPLIPDGGLL